MLNTLCLQIAKKLRISPRATALLFLLLLASAVPPCSSSPTDLTPQNPAQKTLGSLSKTPPTQWVGGERCDVCGCLTATEGARGGGETGGALQLDGSLSAAHSVMH